MRTDRTAAALVAAVAAAIYLPALATGFNADDFLILGRIKSIQAAGDPFGYFKFAFYEYFRPLGFLSFALDWRIWHLDASGFHLTNVALHAANALLVFRLTRKLASLTHATVAGLLFALHPASHEAVYWVAARFDLLATFFVLLSLLTLSKHGAAWRIAGTLAFALALLSKESAIALIIIAPAWDVLIARRDWRSTLVRLVPLIGVAALYSAARAIGADLDATGGARRLPKMLMMASGVVGILLLAWQRDREVPIGDGLRRTFLALASAGALGGLTWIFISVQANAWFVDKLTFVRHVVFYSLSPIVFPSQPEEVFVPASTGAVLLMVSLLGSVAYLAWRSTRRGMKRDETAFALVFTLAALLPVSSMTGGLRYLYLPSAGLALLVAIVLSRLSRRAHIAALVTAGLILAISTQQILQAGRGWRNASTITGNGVRLMAEPLSRCNEDDVLLLTTPVSIDGVYGNISFDAFGVLQNCAPNSFMTLLRVVGTDLRATVAAPSPAVVELRAENYDGNVVASEDLRNFVHYIGRGDHRTLNTSAGRLTTFPDGATQIFRLEMTPEAQAAKRFYYSDGRIRQ